MKPNKYTNLIGTTANICGAILEVDLIRRGEILHKQESKVKGSPEERKLKESNANDIKETSTSTTSNNANKVAKKIKELVRVALKQVSRLSNKYIQTTVVSHTIGERSIE